jgi:hypothetical protein
LAYKTHIIDMGCGATAINPKDIETVSNQMEKQGYKLQQVYVDSTQACCGNKKSAILIFHSETAP